MTAVTRGRPSCGTGRAVLSPGHPQQNEICGCQWNCVGLRVHIDHVAFLAVIVTDHGDIIYSALEYTESFVLLSMITII
jgi:hypothetical protein